MIRQPKEINNIFRKLGTEHYEVYCAGQCVMAGELGENPQKAKRRGAGRPGWTMRSSWNMKT